MGCDIHFHSEVKIKGKWRHHADASLKRDYKIFTKISNVRNDYNIDPLTDSRGLPDDITFLTDYCAKDTGSDGYSHSYLNKEEIAVFHNWLDKEIGYEYAHQCIPYFCRNHLSGLISFPKDWEGMEIEDARYVFWFDN